MSALEKVGSRWETTGSFEPLHEQRHYRHTRALCPPGKGLPGPQPLFSPPEQTVPLDVGGAWGAPGRPKDSLPAQRAGWQHPSLQLGSPSPKYQNQEASMSLQRQGVGFSKSLL